MIKTQILLWKTIEGYGLGLGLGLFYFILNSTPLTHDVYNMLQTLLGQKKYKEEMSDEQPFCVSFSSKSKATNVFPKHILKSKACNQSI